MFSEQIETESVILRRLSPDDVDVFELYDIFGEGSKKARDVFEYIPQEPFSTVKDAHELLMQAATKWEERERARYTVYRLDKTLVGVAVLDLTDRMESLCSLQQRSDYFGHLLKLSDTMIYIIENTYVYKRKTL